MNRGTGRRDIGCEGLGLQGEGSLGSLRAEKRAVWPKNRNQQEKMSRFEDGDGRGCQSLWDLTVIPKLFSVPWKQ